MFVKKLLGLGVACAFGLGLATTTAKAETITFAGGEWAPYVGSNLENQGTITQHIRERFSSVGVEMNVEFMPWKRAYELTRSGKYIATYAWFDTEKRRAEMSFPETPVLKIGEYIVYNAETHPEAGSFASLKELAESGLDIVGIRSFWYEQELNDLGAKVHWVSEEKQAFKMLDAGRADVYLSSDAVWAAGAEAHMDPARAALFKFGEVPMMESEMYLLFSKNHPDAAKFQALWDEAAASQ